jgi:hypothetical protein
MLTKNSFARDFIIRATVGGPFSVDADSVSESHPGNSEHRDMSIKTLAGIFDILG